MFFNIIYIYIYIYMLFYDIPYIILSYLSYYNLYLMLL
jgi:hypothetical protein